MKILNSIIAIAASIAVFAFGAEISAHEGEDHSHEAAPTIASGESMIVRVVRAGDVEITFKHPAIAPDARTHARVFVTRFETNEPIGDANVTLTFNAEGNDSPPATVAATRTATAGLYEIEIPPLPRGSYTMSGRFQFNGETREASFGELEVMPPASPRVESASVWARTALIVFTLFIICFVVLLLLFRARRATHERMSDTAATV